MEPLAMNNNRNRQVILKSRPADIPQADNFEIIEAPPAVPAGSTLAALAARYIR